MNWVNTTLGPVCCSALGRVNIHEHIALQGEFVAKKFPDFIHDDVCLLSREVGEWRDAGGGALIDCSPIGAGRDVEASISVSKLSRVPIILSTGFHKQCYYPTEHWVNDCGTDVIEEILLDECMLGVRQNTDTPNFGYRSEVKAGAVKAAIDENGISPYSEKILRAAIRVIDKSDMPLILHTEPECSYLQVLDWMTERTSKLEKIVFCHMDKCVEIEIIETILQRKAMVEFDSMARDAFSLSTFATMINEFFDKGYGNQLLFGGDLARRLYWKCFGGGPGLVYLVKDLSTDLMRNGLKPDQLDLIWIKNSKRIFQ